MAGDDFDKQCDSWAHPPGTQGLLEAAGCAEWPYRLHEVSRGHHALLQEQAARGECSFQISNVVYKEFRERIETNEDAIFNTASQFAMGLTGVFGFELIWPL
jgi:hypothetical protein